MWCEFFYIFSTVDHFCFTDIQKRYLTFLHIVIRAKKFTVMESAKRGLDPFGSLTLLKNQFFCHIGSVPVLSFVLKHVKNKERVLFYFFHFSNTKISKVLFACYQFCGAEAAWSSHFFVGRCREPEPPFEEGGSGCIFLASKKGKPRCCDKTWLENNL